MTSVSYISIVSAARVGEFFYRVRTKNQIIVVFVSFLFIRMYCIQVGYPPPYFISEYENNIENTSLFRRGKIRFGYEPIPTIGKKRQIKVNTSLGPKSIK